MMSISQQTFCILRYSVGLRRRAGRTLGLRLCIRGSFAFGGAVRFLSGGCGLRGRGVGVSGRFAAGGEDGVLHLAVCHHGRLGGSGRRR